MRKLIFLFLFLICISFLNSATVTPELKVTGNWTGNNIYGGMFYNNMTATELNFAVQDTYYNLFMTNSSHLNGFTFNGGFNLTSNLTTLISGLYQTTFMAIGDGQNNHLYSTSIFINGIYQPNCNHDHKMAAGGDIITQTSVCLIDLVAGDVVDIRTADIGGTGIGNYYGSNLILLRVGD